MKKFLCLIISFILICVLTACGTDGNTDSSTENYESSDNVSSEAINSEKTDETQSDSDVSKETVSYSEDEWRLHPEDFKLLAFTFDDGPTTSVVSGSQVQELTDLFRKYKGGATYFFTGKSVAANGGNLLNYVADNGSLVASHTYNHGNIKEMDEETTDKEFKDGIDAIHLKANIDVSFIRMPGFATSEYVFKAAKKYGTPIIDAFWSPGGDYSGGTATAEGIKEKILNYEFTGGEIIGMHSTHSDHVSYKGLAEVIPYLYSEGYRFVTVAELFELNGIKFEDIPLNKVIKGVQNVNGTVKIV